MSRKFINPPQFSKKNPSKSKERCKVVVVSCSSSSKTSTVGGSIYITPYIQLKPCVCRSRHSSDRPTQCTSAQVSITIITIITPSHTRRPLPSFWYDLDVVRVCGHANVTRTRARTRTPTPTRRRGARPRLYYESAWRLPPMKKWILPVFPTRSSTSTHPQRPFTLWSIESEKIVITLGI